MKDSRRLSVGLSPWLLLTHAHCFQRLFRTRGAWQGHLEIKAAETQDFKTNFQTPEMRSSSLSLLKPLTFNIVEKKTPCWIAQFLWLYFELQVACKEH